MVDMVSNRLKSNSVEQYRKEEKSLVSKRIANSTKRYKDLIKIMKKDTISKPENIAQLRTSFSKFYKNNEYESFNKMGEILQKAIVDGLEYVK